MKAVVCTKYGAPEQVLELQELERPIPAEKRVLVRVLAASINKVDVGPIKGDLVVRLTGSGFLRPKSGRIGTDLAGRVEAVGREVTQFRPGDEVFGAAPGTFAEYASAREDLLVLKPANVSFEQAAAVPVAALSALQGLRKGQIQLGQKVLINGASGGVGMFALQIAKAFGAEVTAVCSTRNLDMVRSIGADHVIDYTQEDFTQSGQQYDLIYCAVGNHSISEYKKALKSQGVCVVAGFTVLRLLFEHMILGPMRSTKNGRRVGLSGTVAPTQKDLIVMKDLIEAGKVTPVIDRCYPLSEAAEAIRYLETGRARGKVVITVEENRR